MNDSDYIDNLKNLGYPWAQLAAESWEKDKELLRKYKLGLSIEQRLLSMLEAAKRRKQEYDLFMEEGRKRTEEYRRFMADADKKNKAFSERQIARLKNRD